MAQEMATKERKRSVKPLLFVRLFYIFMCIFTVTYNYMTFSLEKAKEQERRDARLARHASEREARIIQEKKRRQEELSQREAQRFAERERLAEHITDSSDIAQIYCNYYLHCTLRLL